jgi:hypothetical protein
MNQQQQIQLLNSIMPQIVETRDPEATMLKCARKNNLSPAQLEKLGHVYNTMKTIVGLEKQANRGDSFSILDVPKMVAKYTTYDANAELSAQAEKVHDKVDALMKDADGWSAIMGIGKSAMQKAAAAGEGANDWLYHSNRPIPRIKTWLKEVAEDKGGKVDYIDDNSDEWMEVQASVKSDLKLMNKTASALGDIKRARELWEQTQYEADVELTAQCADLRNELLQDREKWANLVMDARDVLGHEKAAAALQIVENYFERVRCHSFVKSASIQRDYERRLAHDSTGLVGHLEEILELDTIVKRATALLQPTEKAASVPGISTVEDLVSQMRSATAKPDKQKDFDKKLDSAKKQTALENLMLNDSIISTADPNTVQDLHATISQLSPTVASDPVKLAPVLKEALQYDALPIQQIKDLLSVEESAQKVQKLSRENETYKYM